MSGRPAAQHPASRHVDLEFTEHLQSDLYPGNYDDHTKSGKGRSTSSSRKEKKKRISSTGGGGEGDKKAARTNSQSAPKFDPSVDDVALGAIRHYSTRPFAQYSVDYKFKRPDDPLGTSSPHIARSNTVEPRPSGSRDQAFVRSNKLYSSDRVQRLEQNPTTSGQSSSLTRKSILRHSIDNPYYNRMRRETVDSSFSSSSSSSNSKRVRFVDQIKRTKVVPSPELVDLVRSDSESSLNSSSSGNLGASSELSVSSGTGSLQDFKLVDYSLGSTDQDSTCHDPAADQVAAPEAQHRPGANFRSPFTRLTRQYSSNDSDYSTENESIYGVSLLTKDKPHYSSSESFKSSAYSSSSSVKSLSYPKQQDRDRAKSDSSEDADRPARPRKLKEATKGAAKEATKEAAKIQPSADEEEDLLSSGSNSTLAESSSDSEIVLASGITIKREKFTSGSEMDSSGESEGAGPKSVSWMMTVMEHRAISPTATNKDMEYVTEKEIDFKFTDSRGKIKETSSSSSDASCQSDFIASQDVISEEIKPLSSSELKIKSSLIEEDVVSADDESSMMSDLPTINPTSVSSEHSSAPTVDASVGTDNYLSTDNTLSLTNITPLEGSLTQTSIFTLPLSKACGLEDIKSVAETTSSTSSTNGVHAPYDLVKQILQEKEVKIENILAQNNVQLVSYSNSSLSSMATNASESLTSLTDMRKDEKLVQQFGQECSEQPATVLTPAIDHYTRPTFENDKVLMVSVGTSVKLDSHQPAQSLPLRDPLNKLSNLNVTEPAGGISEMEVTFRDASCNSDRYLTSCNATQTIPQSVVGFTEGAVTEFPGIGARRISVVSKGVSTEDRLLDGNKKPGTSKISAVEASFKTARTASNMNMTSLQNVNTQTVPESFTDSSTSTASKGIHPNKGLHQDISETVPTVDSATLVEDAPAKKIPKKKFAYQKGKKDHLAQDQATKVKLLDHQPGPQANSAKRESRDDSPRHGSRDDSLRIGSRDDSPRHGSRDDSLRIGSRDDSPRHGFRDNSPRHGSRDDSPKHESPDNSSKSGSRVDSSKSRASDGSPKRRSQDDSPRHGSRVDSSKSSSSDGSPQRRSQDDSPRIGSRDDSPRHGSRDDSPRHGSRDDSPRHGSRDDSPKYESPNNSSKSGSRVDSSKSRSSDGSPKRRSQDDSPRIGSRDFSPRHESRDNSPRHGTRDGSPRIGSQDDSLRRRSRDDSPRHGSRDSSFRSRSPDNTDPRHRSRDDSSKHGISRDDIDSHRRDSRDDTDSPRSEYDSSDDSRRSSSSSDGSFRDIDHISTNVKSINSTAEKKSDQAESVSENEESEAASTTCPTESSAVLSADQRLAEKLFNDVEQMIRSSSGDKTESNSPDTDQGKTRSFSIRKVLNTDGNSMVSEDVPLTAPSTSAVDNYLRFLRDQTKTPANSTAEPMPSASSFERMHNEISQELTASRSISVSEQQEISHSTTLGKVPPIRNSSSISPEKELECRNSTSSTSSRAGSANVPRLSSLSRQPRPADNAQTISCSSSSTQSYFDYADESGRFTETEDQQLDSRDVTPADHVSRSSAFSRNLRTSSAPPAVQPLVSYNVTTDEGDLLYSLKFRAHGAGGENKIEDEPGAECKDCAESSMPSCEDDEITESSSRSKGRWEDDYGVVRALKWIFCPCRDA